MIGAEGLGELEPPGNLVHHDDGGRPHVLGDGGGLESKPARALDDHAVPEAHPGHVQAVHDLSEGAVDGRHHLIGELRGHREDGAARTEIVVIGEGAVQMRKGAGPERPLDLVRAGGGLLVQTRVAAAARVEVGIGDAVAFLERAAERIGLDPGSELGHPARHLVTEDPAVVGESHGRVPAPEMQVGPADIGGGDADEHGVGVDLGDGHFPDLEGLARPEEDGGLGGGGHG